MKIRLLLFPKLNHALLLLSLLVASSALLAQPANDDCPPLNLGTAPICMPGAVFYDNLAATTSDIGTDNMPPCWTGSEPQGDVFFVFTASDTITDYTITVTGLPGTQPMIRPQIAIYRGICGMNTMALLKCDAAEAGDIVLETDLLDLDPGEQYIIRINDAEQAGQFELCIEQIKPIHIIDEQGSTACSGQLFDTGGATGDYGDDENHIYTICPPFPDNQCITFSLQYYNIETFDALVFYDGSDTSGEVLGQISGGGLASGGGVCYTVQASSGCLTVQFLSDSNIAFEGFAGEWKCSSSPCDPILPFGVDDQVGEEQIVDFISTPQTTVTVDKIICPEGAYGTFEAGDDSDLGLSKGLLLTTGDVFNALGPNSNDGITTEQFAPGDSDLDYLSNLFGDSIASEDACIVELSVFAATNELTFEYVFGSEEYPEWVNQGFNDIFAFLISGPGIAGDANIGNQLNIATLPAIGTPIQINSVNNNDNWQFYRDNQEGQSVEYDGLTSDYLGIKKSLTAQVNVDPCNTYKLKLAIADRGDAQWDSGVFISELKGGAPSLAVDFASGIDYFVEACSGTNDVLVITINSPLDEALSYVIRISGTATQGVDYLLNIPDTIVFQPGETSLSFPIIPLTDTINEVSETIIIALTNDFGCGEVVYDSLEIEIRDEPLVEIQGGADTVFVCQDSCVQLMASGAVDYFWNPINILDTATIAHPIACPTSSQWVEVTGSIEVCSDKDSVFLQFVEPEVTVAALDSSRICAGQSVPLLAANNVQGAGLSWSPIAGLDDPLSEMPVASPLVTTQYVATIHITGCEVSDAVTIFVDPFEFPSLTTTDTTLCEGSSLQLAEPISGSTNYLWSPPDQLDDPTLAGPTLTASSSMSYTLVATSANGHCADSAMVNISVIPADIQIDQGATDTICLGESIELSANSAVGGTFSWGPDDGTLSNLDGASTTATPGQAGWYFVEIQTAQCINRDSIWIQLDSLPELSLSSVPMAEEYCPGDIITLLSETPGQTFFPNMEFEWLPASGYLSAVDNQNMLIELNSSFTFARLNRNGQCVDTSFIDVQVNTLPSAISIAPVEPICSGEEITLQASANQEGSFFWQPGNQEGPQISVSPAESIIYEVQFTGPCDEVFEMVEVMVTDSIPAGIAVNGMAGIDTIYRGEELILSAVIDSALLIPGLLYEWFADGEKIGEGSSISVLASDQVEQYQLVITTPTACSSSTFIRLIVEEPVLVVPDVFSPNADGVNDFFYPVIRGTASLLEFKIWNRYGHLVYDNEAPGRGWSGHYKGELSPSDVYVYWLRYRIGNSPEETVQGDVTLIR